MMNLFQSLTSYQNLSKLCFLRISLSVIEYTGFSIPYLSICNRSILVKITIPVIKKIDKLNEKIILPLSLVVVKF